MASNGPSETNYPISFDWNEDDLKQLKLARNSSGLIINAPLAEPWVQTCAHTSVVGLTCSSPGFGLELTKTICDRLMIKCQFIYQNLTTISDFQTNLVNSITFGGMDTTFPMIYPNPDLAVNLNFSAAAFFTEDAVMIKTQFVYPNDNVFVLKPFRPLVWALIVVSLISVVLLDGLCQLTNEATAPSIKAYFIHAENSWLYHFATLLQRNVEKPTSYWSRRLLMIGWGFAALLLGSSYSAMLVSSRVVPTAFVPFKTLNDLSNGLYERKLQLLVYNPDAQFIRQVQSTVIERYEKLYDALKINPPLYITNLTEGVNSVINSNSNVVLYGSLLTLRSLIRTNCSLSLTPLDIKSWGAYAFRRNDHIQYAHLFSKVILKFLEQGYYIERLEQKYDNGRKCDDKYGVNDSKEDVTDVDAVNLELVFWALICGYATGALILFLELICIGWGSYNMKKSNKTRLSIRKLVR